MLPLTAQAAHSSVPSAPCPLGGPVRRSKSERGATLVEYALWLTLVGIVTGLVLLGWPRLSEAVSAYSLNSQLTDLRGRVSEAYAGTTSLGATTAAFNTAIGSLRIIEPLGEDPMCAAGAATCTSYMHAFNGPMTFGIQITGYPKDWWVQLATIPRRSCMKLLRSGGWVGWRNAAPASPSAHADWETSADPIDHATACNAAANTVVLRFR